jgi:tetratricopeptide (TPR) repeat protein
MKGMLKLIFILFWVQLLISCAGGEVRQKTDTSVETSDSLKTVNVDSDVNADFKSAVVLMQQENYDSAIAVLTSVIEREQRLPAPYVNLAIAYNRTGDDKSAEENLIKALKLDINHPQANNELGLLYRKAGKFNAARTAYENAIKEHPDYMPAKRNLGVLCDLYMRDYECALEQYEDYLASRPDDKNAAIWVADVKRRLGQ